MKFWKMLIMAAALPMFGFAAAIENVIALQRPGTGIVDIYYDLIINEGGTTTVSASVEGGDGEVRMQTLSGDIGHVVPGPARHIAWNAQADNPEQMIYDVRVIINASQMDAIENPGMKKLSGTYYYSARAFPGWWFSYGYSSETVHETGWTFKSPVYIDRMPVSGALWNKVANWAVKNGYTFRNTYSSSARIVYPNVKDACVWCNARSAMEGLPQCQKTSSGYIYRNSKDNYDSPWGFPEEDGGYRLPYEEEMASAFKSGVSGSHEGLVTWMTSAYDAIGYVREEDGVYVFGSLSWSSSTTKPLYCVRDEKPRYPIIETFPPNYSSAFTIDTRVASPTFPKDFKIIDVKSKYCDGKYGAGNKALFLSGVSCNVEFEAAVYGGELAYLERVDNEDAPAVGEQISEDDGKFSLDVGAFAPGDSFIVRAHSVDGRYSQSFRLNFDVASRHRGVLWKAAPGKNSILYRTAEWDSFRIFDQMGSAQPENPIANKTSNFVGDLVGNFSDYPHKLAVGINVCWTMDSSDGVIRGVTMVGGQTTAEVDDILNDKIRNASKALKFGSVSGYVKAGIEQTWSWDAKALDWKDHGDYLAFNAGASGCFAAGWAYGFYYTADGGLDLYLRAPLVNEKLEYMVDTDNLLYLTLRVGWGIPSIASLIEGSGTVSMFVTYDTESDPELQRLGVALALALRSHALGFVVPIWDWKGELYWVGGESDSIDFDMNALVDMAMSNAVTNSTNELSREYTNNCDNASGTSSKYSGFTTDTIVNQYPTSIAPVDIEDGNSGMPAPNPQAPGDTPPMSNDGSSGSGSGGNGSSGSGGGTGGNSHPTTKIVVVADDTSRSSDNRATIITISDTTNATFTTESAVWDDGTPDYCPTTARMTNGCSVVAWMNKREGGAEDPTLGGVMSEMEIAAAVWNGETGEWSHQNLTDNGAYDRSPVLKTATNGTAAVAWLRNAYTNYIGSASKPNQVCFARYVDGAWTTETVVVPSIGRVRKLDMAYDGVHAAIVFNEEDDPGNGTTQRLCVVTGDCSTWESCRVVAESPVNNSAAYAYYDEAGGLRLVWNDEGAIKMGLYANGTLTAETIDTDGHQVPGDYVFTRAHSGRMALVWLEQMKEGSSAMGPVSMTYNPANGLWTFPCALTSDGKNKTDVSAAFNDAGDLEVFYATPNVATNAQGFAETVSSGFSKVTRWHGGDAAILAEDVSFSTNVLVAGETVAITFTVRNMGDLSLSNGYIYIYSPFDFAFEEFDALGVGECQTYNVELVVPDYININDLDYPLLDISLELDDWRADANYMNDWVEFDLTGGVIARYGESVGDSSVALVLARSRADENRRNVRYVSVALENAGLTTVPAGTTVTFRRGDSNGAVLATKTVGKVLVGEEGTQETGFAWDISSIAPTSNVEVVHVTAELPESAVVEQRTLEAEIPVDVSPIVKSPLTAYSLVYDANGGEGAMAAENPFYDEWRLLTSNAFTRAGYVFAGWALSPTGEVAYADGANHWNVPMFSRDTATLYAVWTRQSEKTATTEVPVPFAWLGAYYPEATNSTDNLEQQIANFEAIAHRATGKYDGAGNPLSVWHDYVAGTNPTNPDDTFKAVITLDKDSNGPVISWTPQLTPEETAKRVYRKYGKVRLDDAEWTLIDNDAENYQFFKVTVEMR